MDKPKTLPTLGILSVGDGRLMGDIGDVYAVISFLIGRSAYTHELSLYGKRARKVVLKYVPALTGDRGRDWEDLRDEALARFGPRVYVPGECRGILADDKNPLTTLFEAIEKAKGKENR